MLKNLTIENYALIEKSVVNFNDGFTVITGETGSGKSIMLDALSLLTGGRADSKAIGDKAKKMIVEGIFSNPDSSLKEVFEDNGIEWFENELIIRREISPSGKSRVFVNDSQVNLSLLAIITENLIDIHSQHSNSLLNKANEQTAILDAFGDNAKILEEYRKVFRNYVSLRNAIKNLKEKISLAKENKEFISFRLEQLDKLKPKRGELATLEKESDILGDADRIKSDIGESLNLLSEGPHSALKLIQGATSYMEKLDFDILEERNDNLKERLNNLKIELRDIADTLEGYSEKINSDPQRYEKVQERIEVLYEAMKRFKVKDENELVDLHNRLREEFSALGENNNNVHEMETQLKNMAKILKEKADKLTDARIKAAERFENLLIQKILPLGLPNVKFKIELQKGKLSLEGQDAVTFYCSFNKNHPMQPVSQIASGGEISRVMLGIKSLMAEKMKLPTMIFDEIDTGVSGEIAHKMGRMMKEMAEKIQVMAVTHLPQVAANGNYHLKVYKADKENKTVSFIKELDKEERINELASMLSGTSINDVAIENARILLTT